MAGKTEIISSMGFPLKSSTSANAVISKGRYAVGYVEGDCGNTGGIYGALLSFYRRERQKDRLERLRGISA